MLSNFLACCVDKKTIKRRKHQLFEGKEIASNGCSGTIGLWENIYYDQSINQLVVNLKSLNQTALLQPSEFTFDEQYTEMAKPLCNTLNDKDYTAVI